MYKQGEPALARQRGAHHAVAPSTPLELDQIYQSIDDLTVALGPGRRQQQGRADPAARLAPRRTSTGQGEQFHQTIENLGKLTGTLDDNKEELFGTARQIERFVNALAKNDGTVRRFNDSLASAADLLKDERGDLARRAAQPRHRHDRRSRAS